MQILGLPITDALMLAILVLSALVGGWRGLTFEAASLLGWLVAYLMAQRTWPWVAALLEPLSLEAGLNRGLAFVLAFVVVLVGWTLLARLMRAVVHATPLALPDRLAGLVFGLVRGVVLLLVVATAVGWTSWKDHEAWQSSQGRVWLERILHGLEPYWPEGWPQQRERDAAPETS